MHINKKSQFQDSISCSDILQKISEYSIGILLNELKESI